MKITEKKLREIVRVVIKEEKTAYQKFFDSALKKFGVSSPAKLEGEKKVAFFDYVDKHWEADKETD